MKIEGNVTYSIPPAAIEDRGGSMTSLFKGMPLLFTMAVLDPYTQIAVSGLAS